MVLEKRLDYGFNGFCSPLIPKATRSTRRRGDRKRVEDNQMRAFDLLATVADKLLLEREKSPDSSSDTIVKRECSAQDMPLKTEPSYHDLNSSSKESELGLASVVTVSNNPERLVIEKSGNDTGSFASKVDDFSGYKESGDVILDSENKLMVKYEVHEEKIGLEDPVLGDQKPHALVGLENCSKVLLCADHIFESSYPVSGDDVKVVSRDDDENSFGCSHPMSSMRSFRTGSRIGDRRIRKILASKYWKAGPKYRDVMYSNNGGGDFRPFHRNRKNAYKRLRSQMNIPFKKRRLFYSDSVLKSDSIEKAVNTDASGTGTPSSFVGHHPSFQSRDSHVKLRIKSFRVPELFIEIPDTATVGSLKRSVMEAVTAILGGGLCVGVLVQGKKVKDDNKTLFQTGISHDNQLDSLGFTLEPPASNTTPPPLLHKESPRICPCDAPEPLTSYLPDPVVDDHPGNSDALSFPEPHLTRLGNVVENENHVSALVFPADMEVEKSTVDSKAIVAAPCMTVDPLSAVPVHQRCKRTEVQRRIRRPFSVAEVEALVEAAENFGTGRWRDIKLQAFDHAKHRTYVDLKDKWKTLVHTARISPQQRRGEPVPQELLDRVLAAHAYWSQQQAKQQFKHSQT